MKCEGCSNEFNLDDLRKIEEAGLNLCFTCREEELFGV